LKNVSVISLDLDDTLWSIWPVIDRAEDILYKHICEKFPLIGEDLNAQDLRKFRNNMHGDRPDLAHDLTELRRISFESLLEKYGYDPSYSHKLIEKFMDLRHDVDVFPDVLPALSDLSDRFKLVTLSNGNADISRLDIGKFFSGQINAKIAGVKKPDRKIFHMICKFFNIEPCNIVHIGDHPVEDVIGAKESGLHAVWMNRKGESWQHDMNPDAEISVLTELVSLLDDGKAV
tara:strand:- start:93 stop:788 length:696 start_codon:yes stop_codon:yes gene_type:complete